MLGRSDEIFIEKVLKYILYIDREEKDGYTALMQAAMTGKEKVVDLLIRSGADKTLKSSNEETACFLAWENDHNRIVEKLKM